MTGSKVSGNTSCWQEYDEAVKMTSMGAVEASASRQCLLDHSQRDSKIVI